MGITVLSDGRVDKAQFIVRPHQGTTTGTERSSVYGGKQEEKALSKRVVVGHSMPVRQPLVLVFNQPHRPPQSPADSVMGGAYKTWWQWFLAGKVTVGLALHWPCITQSLVLSSVCSLPEKVRLSSTLIILLFGVWCTIELNFVTVILNLYYFILLKLLLLMHYNIVLLFVRLQSWTFSAVVTSTVQCLWNCQNYKNSTH